MVRTRVSRDAFLCFIASSPKYSSTWELPTVLAYHGAGGVPDLLLDPGTTRRVETTLSEIPSGG